MNLSIEGRVLTEIGSLKVYVYDAKGTLVYASRQDSFSAGYATQAIDIGNLASGLYYYTVSSTSGTAAGKFVKQ